MMLKEITLREAIGKTIKNVVLDYHVDDMVVLVFTDDTFTLLTSEYDPYEPCEPKNAIVQGRLEDLNYQTHGSFLVHVGLLTQQDLDAFFIKEKEERERIEKEYQQYRLKWYRKMKPYYENLERTKGFIPNQNSYAYFCEIRQELGE